MFHRHKWSKWNLIRVENTVTRRVFDVNERTCLTCGVTKRKTVA